MKSIRMLALRRTQPGGAAPASELCRDARLVTHAILFMLALAVSGNAAAVTYSCTFQTGAVVQTQFPCEPAMVDRFGKRLVEIYPKVEQINTSPDYLMGLYTFAMTSCTGQFARMTPEEIGVNGEPFFPRDMLAAMVRAGREVICPG